MKTLFSSFVMMFAIALGAVPAAAQMLYWDIDGQTEGAGGPTPSGMWDASATNWNTDATGGAGGTIMTWDGTAATFSAGSDATGSYDVTVDGTQTVSGGITFDSGNATLTGGTLLLTGAPNIVQVEDSAVGTINSILQGAGLTKSGTGTLVLGGSSGATFTGNLIVNDGTVKITNAGAFGSVGITDTTGAPPVANAVIVSNGATLEIADGVTSTDRLFINGGGFGGVGAIHKAGSGNATIGAGIRFQSNASVISDGGTLTIQQTTGTAAPGIQAGTTEVTFGGAGNITTTGTPNTNLNLGAARLIKVGSGTLTFGGNSSRTGGTTILGGVVSFSIDPASGSAQLGTVPTAVDPSNVIIDGGTLRNTTTTTGFFRFVRMNRGIQLGPNGGEIDIVTANVNPEYDGVIGMTDGTTEATLTKIGAGEFRMQGTATFTKLVVNNGLYRIGNAGTDAGLGAIPGTLKTDAVEINGGSIGTSVSFSMDVKRGVTIGANGASVNSHGGASLTIPGPITGTAGGTLTIFGRQLTTNNASYGNSIGNLILSSTDNLSTFTNTKIVIDSSTLTLNESLSTPNFSGGTTTSTGGVAPAPTGTVTTVGTVAIASGKTFTVGSDNANSSYAGRVNGAGTFTKVGTGILTLNTTNATTPTTTVFNAEWSNTGGVNIEGGTIKYGTPLAGFAASAPVSISSGATLDMNSVNDNFGSLTGSGLVSRTTGNLTLAATAGSATFDGQITGTGTLTKSGGATQILNGNNSFSDVTVSGGALVLNGTNTTGAVAVNGGTLGGTGSVSGSLAVNSAGHLAPGASAGTLSVGGGATFAAGSFFDVELGGLTAGTQHDQLSVTGAATINGGTVAVSLIDGFNNPTLGDSFLILTATGGLTKNAPFAIDATNAPTPVGTEWRLGYQPNSLSLFVALAGDYNLDNKVDAADYVLWRKYPAEFGGNPQGYNTWRANFGNVPPGAGSGIEGGGSVPEPAAAVLMLLGIAAAAMGRRGQR